MHIPIEPITLKGDFPGGWDKSPRIKGRVTRLSRFVCKGLSTPKPPCDGLSHPVPNPKPQPTKQPHCKPKATCCLAPDISRMGDPGTTHHLWMVTTPSKRIRRQARPGHKDTGSNTMGVGGHSSLAGGDWTPHCILQSLLHLVTIFLLSPSFFSLFCCVAKKAGDKS